MSETHQAQHNYAAALANLENEYRETMATTRQEFYNITAGISKIKADQQSVISAKAALDSTEASYKVGTRTMVDVLEAQQNLFQAQEQLANDQYTYINDTLALKQAAGTLCEQDLLQINSWLKS